MTARANNRKTFKQHLLLGQWHLQGHLANFKTISQKCSMGHPLPNLQKWFRSAEQNGRQS